jgi:hypothetical protein
MTAYRQRLIAFEEQKQREAKAQTKASATPKATRKTTKPSSTKTNK